MRTRRAAARWVASIVAGLMAAAAVHGQSLDGSAAERVVVRDDRFVPAEGEPIALHFRVARERSALLPRMVHATQSALQILTAWLGHPGIAELTVAGVAWTADAESAPQPGVVSTPLRWLTFERDRSLERAIIAGIARQFWPASASPAPGVFDDGLAAYVAVRAIHDLLEGSHFEVVRVFGGFVPYPLRTVSLSPRVADPGPRVWRVGAGPGSEAAVRILRGLQTLERYVGWPAMAQALSAMRRQPGGALTPQRFAAVLSSARGSDVAHLVDECFRADARFDYAVDALRVTAAAGAFETAVVVGRHGDGMFDLDGVPGTDRSLPVLVRFADGREIRDWIDGAAPSTSLLFSAPSPGVLAAVDPEVMLLLDATRANNTRPPAAGVNRVGVRLALHWMAWLQNAVLSYTAMV